MMPSNLIPPICVLISILYLFSQVIGHMCSLDLPWLLASIFGASYFGEPVSNHRVAEALASM